MDLFGDLPEPSSKASQQGSSSVTLYDDILSNNDLPVKQTTHPTPIQEKQPEKSQQSDPEKSHQSDPEKSSATTGKAGKRKLEADVTEMGGKKTKTAIYNINSYLCERKGERDEMQDAHLIVEDYSKEFTDLHSSIYRLSVYGVFDGHGGVKASRFASENLHKNLQDKFPKGDVDSVIKELKKTFIDAFKKTDEDFLKEATKYKPPWKDGTTAIILLTVNDIMFIANIGDSQAVLCRYKEDQKSCVAIPLSTAHNPSLYEERMRIQKAGGHVKDGRVMGVLEVSRSIGDGQFKKLGVTCMPEVRKCQILGADRFVIVACDGLWKCFEPQESIKFVNEILQDESIKGTETKTAEEVRYETACARLANEAVLRLSADNVTVLLLAISKNTAAS